MISGTILRMPPSTEVEQLNGLKWEREEKGRNLTSVVQLQANEIRFSGSKIARTAIVIHQRVGFDQFLKEEGGIYTVDTTETIKTEWANVYLTPSFIAVDSRDNVAFVRDTFNEGLRLP